MNKSIFFSPVWKLIIFFFLIISPVFSAKEKLMVFMLDGFRWDYFDKDGLSGLKYFLHNSTRVEYLENSFPTLSFPNYYTIMTGLYSEDHGFIDNSMYDPIHDTEFLMGSNPDHYAKYWWDDGEPVWITARKQGKKSYMYFWPGCEVTIRNFKPNYCREYKGPPTMSEFRDAIWDGLNAFLDDSADLVAIYFELTDKVGHMFGPDSFQLKSVLSKLGDALETMLIQMKIMHLTETVNIMLFSDHGMTNISPKRVIDLNRVLDPKDVRHMYPGPFFSVWPHKDKIKKVYNNLKNCHKNLSVFYKEEIPERWHLKNHYRVAPIVAVADLGFYIIKPPDKHFPKVNGEPMGGYHGYDNAYPDMRGIFVASGPEFKKNEVIPWAKAVDIYQLMCKLLDINPAPHRGNWANIAPMLIRPAPMPPASVKPTAQGSKPFVTTTTTTPTTTTTTTTTTEAETTPAVPTTLQNLPPKTSSSLPSSSENLSTSTPSALPPEPTQSSGTLTSSQVGNNSSQSTSQTQANLMSSCQPLTFFSYIAIILMCIVAILD